jgi:hypothetical protein
VKWTKFHGFLIKVSERPDYPGLAPIPRTVRGSE